MCRTGRSPSVTGFVDAPSPVVRSVGGSHCRCCWLRRARWLRHLTGGVASGRLRGLEVGQRPVGAVREGDQPAREAVMFARSRLGCRRGRSDVSSGLARSSPPLQGAHQCGGVRASTDPWRVGGRGGSERPGRARHSSARTVRRSEQSEVGGLPRRHERLCRDTERSLRGEPTAGMCLIPLGVRDTVPFRPEAKRVGPCAP